MDDPLTFGTVVEYIKAATGFSKELLALNIRGDVKREVSEKVSEIDAALVTALEHAATAYSIQMEQTKLVGDLEKEVVRLEDWNVNKIDYELKSIDGTSFAYMIKESVETTKPKHWLCETCFHNSKESILQRKEGPAKGRGRYWVCNGCGATILVDGFITPSSAE